ncbi:hypothetical protein I7I53_00307 [Histoplasma capsulatum var. duboisii H88]|uniref:Uncharacterized protein n=1 Tax=Ajellomyces capsulatus (strain H88) TaxID=544711 RepID=A0A8A1LI13_AJEC8|nr:hypothetical protein I7I53_00307 [Histoplasma capsulatum var. duboisii H88]
MKEQRHCPLIADLTSPGPGLTTLFLGIYAYFLMAFSEPTTSSTSDIYLTARLTPTPNVVF